MCMLLVMVCMCVCRSKLLEEQSNGEPLPSCVCVLPNKPQVQGMHTMIRCSVCVLVSTGIVFVFQKQGD